LTGPLQLADGFTLRGGTIRGHWMQVVGGEPVRIEGVTILDSRGAGVGVRGAGSRASVRTRHAQRAQATKQAPTPSPLRY